MKVIIENATGEIVEKKSRFIANIFYVANIEDANEKLNQIKKSIMMQSIIVMHML